MRLRSINDQLQAERVDETELFDMVALVVGKEDPTKLEKTQKIGHNSRGHGEKQDHLCTSMRYCHTWMNQERNHLSLSCTTSEQHA
ncbi:hypothetical protein PIB30_049095 [Stylosanthes scabra]|uniref:Uncharacterized protein n=1 Tax=Stylosanthes scabra TaxID=79078 RepID=A0ABU6SI01_9FABA|nr:hypothetical protein [Stylosanthes scabra]